MEAKNGTDGVGAKAPPLFNQAIQMNHLIYFIGNKDMGWVKIGHTGTLRSRLSAIQTSCQFKVSVLGTMRVTRESAIDSEAMLHRRFSANRLNGEWFGITEQLLEFIASNCDPEPTKVVVQDAVRVIPPIDFMTERKIAKWQKPRKGRWSKK